MTAMPTNTQARKSPRLVLYGLAFRILTSLALRTLDQKTVRAARKLESLMKFWDIDAANELLRDRSENEAYLAASPPAAYALYFTDGGSVGLDLAKAPGRYELRWIDIATGQWGARDSLEGGGVATLTAPGKGHWLAAIVRAGEGRR